MNSLHQPQSGRAGAFADPEGVALRPILLQAKMMKFTGNRKKNSRGTVSGLIRGLNVGVFLTAFVLAVAGQEPSKIQPPTQSLRSSGSIPSFPSATQSRSDVRDAKTQAERRKNVLEKYKESTAGQKKKEEEETPNRPLKDMVSEPWLSPKGERLVAVVEDRYLTKGDLDLRLKLVGEDIRPDAARDVDTKRKLEQQKVDVSQTIVSEWVMNAVLALEALRNKYAVSDVEVDAALAKLSENPSDKTKKEEASTHVKLVGVPQDQMRAEIRDGLLIEKFIMDVVKSYDRSYYQKIYDAQPAMFLIPPRVHVFDVFRGLDASMTAKQQKDIRKDLEEIRKELKKPKPDYAMLTQKSDTNLQLSIGDMGWVAADTDLPPALHKVIFSLDPGQTSDIFLAGLGAHVIRVIEREEGSKFTLEAAMPQLQNYLFNKTKPAIYEGVRGRYKIHMNSGGLNKWRDATPDDAKRIAQKPAKSAEPPPKPQPLSGKSPVAEEQEKKKTSEPPPTIDLNVLSPQK